MTTMTRDRSELRLAEDPAIELLELIGYSFVSAESVDLERLSTKETVLRTRLARVLRHLNPWLSPTNVEGAIRAVVQFPSASLAEANQHVYTSLTHGISLPQDRGDGIRNYSVRFFDFENPFENDWIVTRQYRVRGAKQSIIPDVVAFVNGLPLAVIECKSPTIGDAWKRGAINQLHRYQEGNTRWRDRGAPKFFETIQILIGTCGERAVYGTVGTPERFFLEWKEPYPLTVQQLEKKIGRMPTPQDILLYGLLEPRNMLDIVRNFVVFEVEGGRSVRKLARYKQFIAVNQAITRIRSVNEPHKRGGIVWHTQGSGKSLTMLWLALKLRRDELLLHPTVVIVTDRTKLDLQISGVFTACGFPNPERAKTVRALRQLLKNSIGKTVITTIQKFQEIAKGDGTIARPPVHPVLSNAPNIFVMVDEAHRTQYANLAANMRKALPHACFLGFTGTPIDKRSRSTFQTFGSYIDTYTIDQAVQDGATVPIFYEARLAKLQIVGQTLDQLFDRVFADQSEHERSVIRKLYANQRSIAEAPRRIESICLDLMQHFEQFIAPNKFKAQIVTTSRHTAVIYKQTLERLNGPESALIISSDHNDDARMARWKLRKDEQDRLIERFRDREDRLCILVVCDMLLTGFDAPIEQVMYLDAPLKEHTLLQAIARVNRPYSDVKTFGLIVDYWGVSVDLQAALSVFSSTDVRQALRPTSDELPRLQSRHAGAMKFFQSVEDRNDLEACLRVLDTEDMRAEFDLAFRKFSQTMDMLLPDPRALPFQRDLCWLGKIRGVARARYMDGRLDLSGCGEKVRKLIDDAVVADGVETLVREVQLFSSEFDRKLDLLSTDRAKASEMEHAIRHEISVRVAENPALYESLRKRLEEIIQKRRMERLDDAKQLSLLSNLRDELKSERARANEIGLGPRGFAFYGILQQRCPNEGGDEVAAYNVTSRDLAQLIDDDITPSTNIVDWEQKEDVQRQIRRLIKRRLREGCVDKDKIESLAVDLLALAKVRIDR